MSLEPALPERTELPPNLVHVRTTDVFDNESVPKGLLRAHRVADSVWGRLVVHSGAVVFVFEDDAEHPIDVGPRESVVIPPARLHHLELGGPATFAVEFHREEVRPEPELRDRPQ